MTNKFTEEEIYELIGRMPTYTDIFNAAYKLGEESSKQKWHKVAEEGLPKGDYEGNKLFNVVVSTYNKFLKEWFTCIWHHICSFDGVSFHYEDIDGEVYEILAEEVVAWQNITPYKEG